MLRKIVRWHPPPMHLPLPTAALVPVTAIGALVDDPVPVGSPIRFEPSTFAILTDAPNGPVPPSGWQALPAAPTTSCGMAAAFALAITAVVRTPPGRKPEVA